MKKFGKYPVIGMIAILFLTVVYFVYAGTLVSREAERMNRNYWEKVAGKKKSEQTDWHQVPGYADLLKRKSMLEAMVKMAASDSIGLWLNLQDRTARLLIKGVAVREIPLEKIDLPSFMGRIDEEVLYDWMARPMKIVCSRATIAKEPIQVVEAPEDTLDIIPRIEPDTSRVEPVFFVLDTDCHLRYSFYQTDGGLSDRFAGFVFGLPERWKKSVATLKGRYEPEVRIGIGRENAQVLYRALPLHGFIILTL